MVTAWGSTQSLPQSQGDIETKTNTQTEADGSSARREREGEQEGAESSKASPTLTHLRAGDQVHGKEDQVGS